MAKLGINTGSSPDAGDGDALLIGAIKINSNFNEIYSAIGDGSNITNSIGYASTAGISTYASSSRIVVKDSGSTIGTAGTIDFGANLSVSAISAGVVTVTASTGTPSQWVSTAAGIHTLSNVGVGTTNPGEKLQVDGNIRVGISTTSNYIAFRGTSFDGPFNTGGELPYQHTYIGERIYDSINGIGERSELLLFKGNDIADISGPDRIRLFAGEHRFDVLGFSTTGTFEQVGVSTAAVNKLTITSTGVGVGTTNPTSALTVTGSGTSTSQLYVTGISTFAGITTVTGPTLFSKQLNVSGVSTFNNDVNFRRTNGSSGVYWDAAAGDLRIESSASASITFDNTELLFDGTDFLIKTESLKIKKRSADENIAVFTDDSSVELYFDNSKKFETLGTGVTITGQISASAGVLAGTLSTFTAIRVANDAGNNTAQYITVIGQNSVTGFNTGGGYPENKYFQFSSGNPNFILENVGIGTTNATSKLTVRGGDISVGVSTAHGVILTSPNGTQYRLIVDDSGTLSTVAV